MSYNEIPSRPIIVEKIWLKSVLPPFLKQNKFPQLIFEKKRIDGAKGTILHEDHKTFCNYIIYLNFSSN